MTGIPAPAMVAVLWLPWVNGNGTGKDGTEQCAVFPVALQGSLKMIVTVWIPSAILEVLRRLAAGLLGRPNLQCRCSASILGLHRKAWGQTVTAGFFL